MVCTYTNVAVDNLVEGFVTAGLDPVRIGYGQIKSTLQEHSFEFKIEKHPLYPKYKVRLRELEEPRKGFEANVRSYLRTPEAGAPSWRALAFEKLSGRFIRETIEVQLQKAGYVPANANRSVDQCRRCAFLHLPTHSGNLWAPLGVHYLYQLWVSPIERHGLSRGLLG
jgi:hypothetical protein